MLVKRFFACLLALALLVGMLSGCAAKPSETAAEPMVLFTDSLGRKVRVPASLTRVAPSGAVASMFLAVVAPEYMSTIAVLQPVQIPRPAPHRFAHDWPDVRQQVDAQS